MPAQSLVSSSCRTSFESPFLRVRDHTYLRLNSVPIWEALQTLEELRCGGAPIKDISLTHLKKIPSLRILGLGDTKVTDGGTETLASLELNELRLAGCKITDNGLGNLQSLKSLKKLYVTRTSVTRKGITEFRKALPECEVISDFTPPKPK